MPLLSRISYQIYNPSSVVISAMNAMLDLLRLPGKKGFSTTKFALLLAEILFAVIVAWFAIPFVFGFLGSAVPRLWVYVRSATAPPYLFLAINFIILTIWKLSENRSFYTDSLPEEDSNSNPGLFSLRSRDLGSAQAVQLLQKSLPEDCNKAHSISAGNGLLPDYTGEESSLAPAPESSCLTAESEEKSISSPPPPPLGFSVPEPALAAMDPEREEVAMVDGRNEDDSLNATWNSIMRKSRRFPAPPAVGKSTPRECNPSSECNDDINQRFDDFIKKNYDQIRLRKPGGLNQH